MALAVIEALGRGHEEMVTLLMEKLDDRQLAFEFRRLIDLSDRDVTSLAGFEKAKELRTSLDLASKYLMPERWVAWTEAFPMESLPITRALIRQWRVVELGATSGSHEESRRSRVRP